MRESTVNLITLYQTIGAVVNIVALLLAYQLVIGFTEFVVLIAAVNICYVLVSRDVARKHEMICSLHPHTHGKPTS